MKIKIKPLSDREGEGILDKRVLADAKIAVGVAYPADNSHIKAEEIELIRKQVGAPNIDIVKGNIQTDMIEIPGDNNEMIPVRVYGQKKEGINKALLYIHGGGFLAGTIDMCDNLCRGIAKSADITVFSVDYRLAPEYRFPVQLDECFSVLAWIAGHAEGLGIDRDDITVCGDSAGGNLAAVCAVLDREKHTGYVKRQILLYPALNIGKFETKDYCRREDCYICGETGENLELQKRVIADVGIFDDLMQHIYVNSKKELVNPYVCPVLLEDFSGLPETVAVVGEFDYLRPEIMYYAEKLDEAGTDVTYIQYQGINHGFAERLGAYPQAEDLMNVIVQSVMGKPND